MHNHLNYSKENLKKQLKNRMGFFKPASFHSSREARCNLLVPDIGVKYSSVSFNHHSFR